MRFPEELGGRGLDWSHEVLALEEIGVLGTNEIMSLVIQHDYYRELLGAAAAARDVESDAPDADVEGEKVYD